MLFSLISHAQVMSEIPTQPDHTRRVVLVACEPAGFGDDEWGAMELIQPVAAAIDVAADLVEQVVHQLLTEESSPWIPATQATHKEAARSSLTARLSTAGE